MHDLSARLLAALPQTQCTRCGYPDCAAYAQAIASGEAAINQCPPGGIEGVQRLAALTGQPVMALNPENGSEGPRQLAVIDEAWCIGCTLCLDACPVDAIVGSNKLMHTVIEACCTGCELCIPVCPVDCISLENISAAKTGWAAWSEAQAEQAGRRYQIHSHRSLTGEESKPEGLADPEQSRASPPPLLPDRPAEDIALQRKRSIIDAALASAKARRSGSSPG